ncbi:VWA domain-containing protein [Thermosipho ferrireducens]|uniref:VWA domain-containing protein n=1 Tax=Thermosipho ferrireducens TaxID=2571116 RepID=A0ABX7S9F6_9BACT|nr:vWA domain-containing protein [Thermosipho ferrireducens]QTA37998.1 VWA domain-containing protein [Thermosipho ferrireducens]
MKKLIVLTSSIAIVVFLLFSCTNIPTLPKIIPPDPTGVVKPDPANFAGLEIYLSTDKMPFLVPLAVPDYIRIRISVPELTELTEDDILLFEDNKAQGFVLFKESERRSAVDIIIVIDTTGSMYNAIEGVKASIIAFIDSIKGEGLDARVGIIPFDDAAPARDIYIDGVSRVWQDLTDPDTAKTFADKLYADGGGDWPENPYAALMYAWENASWRTGAQRILILITDATAHYASEPDPGDAYGEDLYDKEDVIDTIRGYGTVHGAFVPKWPYSDTNTDFSAPDDPREIVVETGGILQYTDSIGNVDLTALGIAEYIASSWIVAFESDSPAATHTIEVFIEQDLQKGYAKLENVNY